MREMTPEQFELVNRLDAEIEKREDLEAKLAEAKRQVADLVALRDLYIGIFRTQILSIGELEAQLAEAKRDTARLDRLGAVDCPGAIVWRGINKDLGWVIIPHMNESGPHATLREAIDAMPEASHA